ncbi:hypothetical protein ACIBG4_33635 [Nonomuraea sp. NPDC050383]|uniref:hypothetical protein n=1 Tax=Nonomuraea sp. NPDC050383 TaxID=3364362 RepID=UPI0037A046B1
MDDEAAEDARRWLAEVGVTQVREGVWASDEPSVEELLTANDVAHTWTSVALEDPDLDAAGRLRLALGLLDLLDDYWVTCEIRFAVVAAQDLRAETLWDGYRRRLEASESPEPVTYSLWVDWFEDRGTVEVAFAEVLGNDIEQLLTEDRLHALTQDPLFRRAQRVLEISGPVPWPLKHPVYQAVVEVPALHPALFQGLLSSYHDFHGDLEPHAARALLQRLDLPPGIKGLAQLRAVLQAGHRNHYRAPDAWRAADCETS